MANTVANVTTGKPNAAGAIYRAPLGTALPTDATTQLPAAFLAMGYCSEDGVVNENSPESDSIKAWGGDTVLTYQESKEDTFQFTMIEAENINVLKAVYGSTNVTSTSDAITVQATADEPEEAVWVIDMVYRGDKAKRIVIPDGKISEIGEISYTDTDAVGYEVTVSAMPDTNGVTHYEYIA